MRTLNSKAICLLLALATTQTFAQRFTTTEPDVFQTASGTGNNPQYKQIAALGEKNSAYANLILIGGKDTLLDNSHNEKVGTYNVIKSDSTVLGTVCPFSAPNVFISNNDTIHDNSAVAVVVLEPLSDSKKTAIVVFASLRNLVIMQITISNANSISSKILGNINMSKFMWEINGAYDVNKTHTRRLALLGTSQSGANKVYHLATGNPLSKNGNGRVDFFNITENTWTLLQPNPNGLTSGTNGLVFNDSAYFGKDLAVIDNFDKKGGKLLAVLLPNSKQFPQSALYLFQMDNDWTPSTKLPVVIAGQSKSWFGETYKEQSCGGLGIANLEDKTPHLLVSCIAVFSLAVDKRYSCVLVIKDIVIDSTGNILSSSTFFSEKISRLYAAVANYSIYSGPISIKNHKNDLHSIFLIPTLQSNFTQDIHYQMAIFTVMDADYSKNFTIAAGTQESIVNIDSLFYKSGATGFSAKTFLGSAKCEIQGMNLVCQGSEKTIGSWSGIELSSNGNCDLYKACKKKDTIFVYVRSANETSNTAFRVPKSMLVPYFGSVSLGNLKPLSYFKNPNLQNTNISWNTAGLKFSALANTPEKGITITPYSQKEGIDTLIFDLSFPLSVFRYPIYLHIADTAKILRSTIPANPSSKDTIWNTAQKKYIALPRSSSKGDIYTYDIVQDSLRTYAEIIDNYLHILKVDIADISLAYTENGQIKYRKITLMPEYREPSTSKIANLQALNLNVVRTKGGLQIKGLNGEFELRAYNLKGREIQREKAYAQGSVFMKLRHNCPQIVQIRFGSEKISIVASPR